MKKVARVMFIYH